jgi:hypothetical protein
MTKRPNQAMERTATETARSRLVWLERFHFKRRALSVAVAHLVLVRP